MKSFLVFIFFFLVSVNCVGQSYLGWTTKPVNFREGPSVENNVISSLKAGSQIFIVSKDAENDFIHIIDIRTDREGYIHKYFVRFGQIVKINDKGIFTENGEASSVDPEIEIFNNTSLILTLKLNEYKYTFSPNEKRKIILTSGSYEYRASAPGVIPNIGTENIANSKTYAWKFYIITKRR